MAKVALRETALPLQQFASICVLKYVETYTCDGRSDVSVAPSPTSTPFLMRSPDLSPSGIVTDMIPDEFPTTTMPEYKCELRDHSN